MQKLLGLSVLALLIVELTATGAARADHMRSPVPNNTGSERLENGANASIPERELDVARPTQEVMGRVVDIDRARGALMLQTAQGLLALQGPPEALTNVSVGDLVKVRLALDEEEPTRETY
jgi:hypothetical protein